MLKEGRALYETSDLAIAAYLMLHDFKLLDASRLASGKFKFVFVWRCGKDGSLRAVHQRRGLKNTVCNASLVYSVIESSSHRVIEYSRLYSLSWYFIIGLDVL